MLGQAITVPGRSTSHGDGERASSASTLSRHSSKPACQFDHLLISLFLSHSFYLTLYLSLSILSFASLFISLSLSLSLSQYCSHKSNFMLAAKCAHLSLFSAAEDEGAPPREQVSLEPHERLGARQGCSFSRHRRYLKQGIEIELTSKKKTVRMKVG